MAIPTITLTIRDPGLSLTGPATLTPLLVGTASAGAENVIVPITSNTQAVDTFAQGPLPELATRVLSEAGGPVLCARMTAGVAGAAGAVAVSRVDSSSGTVALSGEPSDRYSIVIEIATTGTLGAGRFIFSLDGGATKSAPTTIPAGGVYVIPDTGLTATFDAGIGPVFFEEGDVFSSACTAPYVNASNLDSLITAVQASNRAWRFLCLAGHAPSAIAGATLAAAMATHMTTLAASKRYRFAMLDSGGRGAAEIGEDDAEATTTAYAAVADTRLGVGFGEVTRATSKPIVGWGAPEAPAHHEVAARIAAGSISTHAGRVASHPLPGVLTISHDERVSPGMRDAGFATLRTWDLMPGFYPTDGRIKAPPGSDFQRAELRMVMDVACETTVEALTTQANKSVHVLTDGTGRIHPVDAAAWREVALRKLRVRLTQPLNAEGTRGHVSGLDVTVDPEYDVLNSGEVAVDVALVPLGYAERITIGVGYAQAI